MAHEVGPLISQLLQRVRDPHAIGTTRDLTRKALDQAQKVVNSHAHYVIVDEPLATEPNRLIYPISSSLPLSARILAVFDSDGRELDLAFNWRNLSNLKGNWFRDVASYHKMWSTIGRDLLVLYPAKSEPVSFVTVRSVKLTSPLVDDDTLVEIDQSNDSFLLDVAELILTIKNRNLPTAMALLKYIQQKVKPA